MPFGVGLRNIYLLQYVRLRNKAKINLGSPFLTPKKPLRALAVIGYRGRFAALSVIGYLGRCAALSVIGYLGRCAALSVIGYLLSVRRIRRVVLLQSCYCFWKLCKDSACIH